MVGSTTSGTGVAVGTAAAATAGTSVRPTSKNTPVPNRLGFCQELSIASASDQINFESRSASVAPFAWAWKPTASPCSGVMP